MRVEKVHNNIRYTLSNEGLQTKDKVYPIANGRCLEDGGWVLHEFDFRQVMSGFPNEPHTMLDLKHSDYKPYQIRTDYGYGPVESYFKIIKKEKQEVKVQELGDLKLNETKWVEIKIQ